MNSFSLSSNLKRYFEESERIFDNARHPIRDWRICSSSPSDRRRSPPFRMKPDDRNDREQDEQNKNDQLGKLERLLGLRRCNCVQSRYFFERLDDENEDVEVK